MADWDGFKVLSLPGDESLPAPRRDRLSANEAGLARHVALTPDEQAESGAAWEEGRTSGELNAAISDARRKGDSRALAALIDARDGPNPFSDEPRGVNRRPADPWAGFKVVSQPKAADLSPDALGKTASGDYLDAIGKGFSDLGTSLQSAKWVVTGKGTPEIAKALADQIANSNASAGEREIQGAVKSVNDAKGGWETAKSIGNLLWSFVSNPYDAGKMVVQQLPNALPSMATGAAGAGAGGLIGGPVGAVGGGLTGLAAGSGVVEFGAKLADKVGEALGNRPATPENIQAILEQPGFRDAAMQEGAAKGVTVGAIDALSAALGGRIATAPFRAAAKKALAREGIDLADTAAVNAALKTAPMQAAIKAEMAAVSTGRKVGMGATGVAADSTLEGVGEYAGEYAATGQGKLGDAILEGVTSLGQSVAEVSASAALQRGQGLIGGAPAAAEQRKQAVEDIARAPNVDSAIEAFTRATAPTPAATADAPIESDRLGALGLINAAPIAAPEQVGPQHPLGDPNAIPYDYSTPAQRFAALPAPEAATGSGILVNDGDAELTRPEQFGDRETRINATQRARKDEADAPAVRDIVQTPEGPRRRPRVTLDEAGNVIDASPEDRQFLSLTRRDARPHAAAAIEAHAINPDLVEAALAAPDMGPKAERTIFEAIINGTVRSTETRSLLNRYGIPGRLADGNGQGAQPGAAPAPGANPPGTGPGTGQGTGAQPDAGSGNRGQGVAQAAPVAPAVPAPRPIADRTDAELRLQAKNTRDQGELKAISDELARRRKAAQPETEQDKSRKEWQDNYDRVASAPDLAAISTKDIERAINYASHRLASEGRKGWSGGEVNTSLMDSIRREIDNLKFEVKRRQEPTAPVVTAAPAANDSAPAAVTQASPENDRRDIAAIRRDATLDKMTSENGIAMTRRQWVEQKIADGLKPRITQEDRIKPMSRMQYFRANNEEQRAHEKRIKEAGKKDVFWIGDYAVSKTEHDYAASLLNQQSEPTAKAKTRAKLDAQKSAAPLYASRPVTNAADIIAWAQSQGFKTTLPAGDLHVTVAYSREPVNGASVPATGKTLKVLGDKRAVEPLGDEGAVVLKFASKVLQARWQAYRNAGASWDYEGYQPHITITYDGQGVDLTKVEPYRGPINLGPEKQEPLNEDKAEEYVEEPTSDQPPPTPVAESPEKPKGDTDASLDRSRPREFMAFSKPYEGATGAKLVGYEWAQRKEEYVDRRGENRTRRVSDWDQAVKNLQTGRDVVHQFHITTKDGENHIVSAETAADMLGVAQSTVRTNAVRLLQQEIDARKKGETDAARVAELDAMESFATPAAAIESRKPDGYIARVVDRALSEGKTWGSADGDAPGREKYRFLKRDGKFIFSPELVTDGSVLHAAGWRTVELRANEIWNKEGEDKTSAFRKMVDEQKADRVRLEAKLERLFLRDGGVKATRNASKTGQYILLTAGTTEAPYRVTSIDDEGPSGHRDYNSIAEAANEFAHSVTIVDGPAPKVAKPVTPQVASAGMLKTFIGIAADSIEQLRKVDVERVLTSNPKIYQAAIAQHIKDKRPDLAGEVDDVLSDQPPPTPVAESQDDEAWLRELFSGTAATLDPEQKQGESDLAAVRAAIASVRAATERDLADWESRTYKENKSQVEFRGDGPARRESMSIGAINAGRRDKAIAAFKQQLAALGKIEARIATPEGAREFKRMLDETWQKAVEGVKVDPRFKTAGELFETLVLRDLQPAQGSITSNPLSRALLALVEPGDRGVAPAQEKGAAEPAPAIFGLSGAQLEAMQGGKLRGAEQFTGVAPTEQQVADRKALVAKRKADEAAAVDKAALDPRIAALRESGVEAGILLKAEKELKDGDDSLIKDMARIQGIELPAEPKAESVSRETPKDEPLASRSAPTEAVADMFGYTDADEDALLLDMDAQERAEYEKAKPRGMSWLDYAKQRYAKISHEHKGGDPRPYVSATYGADSPWQEAARGRDGDALQALRSEAARLEKDAPAYLYVNDDGTARITVFDVRDVPKRMLAFAARNNLKTDVVVNAGMLRAGQAMPADFRASGAKYAEEVKDPGAKAPLASRPGYTAPYRDLDAYRFTVAKDARGLPVYMSRNITLADGRVKDALGVPNGGRAIAFDIYDNRMRDAEGDPTVVGQVLVHQDAAGKFASFRNISIAKEYRNQGYYHGEGVVAGMLQHNGTTPMEVFNIQSAARGDKDDALPFWKKIGTTILNYSSTQDVDIEGNISLSRYLKAGEKRGINGQSSRDRREQPVSRRDGARGEQPDAGGNRGAQSLRASQSRTVRAVRAELTEAFGEDGVAALERAGILNITTWDAAPKGLTDQLQSGDNGAYWPSRQTAYIFADNLAPGQAAEVLLHEIGEHYGLEGLLGDQYGRVVAQVKTLHKAGQPEIVAAWRHVERNYDLTPGSAVFMKEVIARAGQSAKVRGMAWWQRMMDAIRAFLLKTGIKGVTSARDLGVLLQASVRKAMRDAKGMAGPVAVNADDYGMASRLGDQLKGLNKDTGGDLFKGAPELEGGMSFRDRQTSSPAFKRWFGDSKVVDADGNPLVVYHGTVGDHTFFDAATQGQYTNEDHGAQEGFFFTASKSDAGFFMERAWERRGGDRDANGDLRPWDGRVLEVYLQAQNPYTPPDEQSNYEAIRYAKANGFDAVHLPDGDDVNPGNTWIVFRPNQIKSAIDNNGNFDPNEPSVLASRGTIGATWDMLQSAKTPAQARTLAMNLFDNPNKFNLWDKTIGTQLNKARKNEHFRAVFDNLQGQQDSTAAYAIEAEAEAADVLARMEGAAEIKSALKSTLTGERARDLQAVSKAIFANIEGKQGVKQKVFTDAELAKDFGLNDRQIGLYRQSRAAIDRSLDRYAQSLAVRMAQKFVYTGDLHRAGLDDTVDALTERLRLQRQVLEEQRLPEQSLKDMEARLAELEELQDSTPREILRSLQTGPDGETRQEYASMPDTAATAALQREIRDLKRAIRAGDEINPANRELDAKIQALDAALERLPEIADQAHSLQNAGYAPAMRFGDYAVTAYDASGETQFFTMVDTKTQANLLKMRLARELPGARIVVNPVDKESYKLFGGVDPATVELFARFMEVEETDAFKAYIALATSSRSALKHMLERKGIAGFSDNLPRVMAAFITSNARAAARNVHAFDVNAAMETAQREARGDVSEEAARLVNYMNNPTGDFAKVRGFMFAYFMGGSVSSALVNLTQPLMMTTPYLQQFAGAKIGAIMTRAAKAAATGKVEGAAKAALARAEAEGITDAHEYFQLMQEAEGGGSVPTRALMKAWGSMFGAAERFNRRITFLAAFEVAQSMAQKDLQARGVGDAYEFAKDAVVETQGLYNRANRPNWARTPLGALALTFKQFSIAWLEFFMRLPRKQQLMAVGLLILMAGLEGLPFAEDLEDLIDTIGQRMGYGTNSKRALRQAATSMLGETGAQFALHGISGLSGMPMDVAGRLGMGNLIPGTKLLNPSVKEKARELAEVAGPAAGLAQKAGGIAEGNLKEAMPKAFADAAKAWEIFQTGEYRDTRGRKVMEADGLDALMKLVGFQPRDVAANTRFIGEQMRDVEIVRRVESEIVEQWADGVRNKDVAESTEARERLKRWNAENPDLPIKVTFAQILRRVKQANLTRDERFMKTAPPELRRRMLAETAVQ